MNRKRRKNSQKEKKRKEKKKRESFRTVKLTDQTKVGQLIPFD